MSRKTKFLFTLLILVVLIAGSGMTVLQSPLALARPQVTVTQVIRNRSVDFSAQNFRSNENVEVLIGIYGTHGVDGIKVGSFRTTQTGTLRATVSIPSAFRGEGRLDLRVQRRGYNGVNQLDYYAYTTFRNRSPRTEETHRLIPIRVVDVVHNKSVTVRFGNLPAQKTFEVRLSGIGGKQRGPLLVGTFASGAGGSLVATYPIPKELADSKIIFVIAQSTSRDYSGTAIFMN